jgi:hypothetical protein
VVYDLVGLNNEAIAAYLINQEKYYEYRVRRWLIEE